MRMPFLSASNLLIAFSAVDLLIVGIIESALDIPYLLPLLKWIVAGLFLLLIAYGIRELRNGGSTFKAEFVRSWFVVALFPFCAVVAILIPPLDKHSLNDMIEAEGYVADISQNWSSGTPRSPRDERWITIDDVEGDFKHLFAGSFIERHGISEGVYLQIGIRGSSGVLMEASVDGVSVVSVEESVHAVNRKHRFLPIIMCVAGVIYLGATRGRQNRYASQDG